MVDCTPDPNLLESMRSVGYSLNTAVADIIDNSIAAHAKTISIRYFDHGEDPYVAIIDDGDGMDYETAVKTAQSYRNSRVWRGRMPGDNFTVDGVSYYFTPDSDRVLRLDSVDITPSADSGTFSPSFLRGAAIGSSLQSILDTIPVDSQVQLLTLPQEYYRTQDLYGSNAASSYAFLGADTSYHMRFYTENFCATLRFDDSDTVIEIFLSVRH